MDSNDRNILTALKNMQTDGMTMMFRHYFKPLVFFADQFLHDMSASEDIVQDQFVKFWERKLFKDLHEKALSTFLFTLVRNACLNQLEKKGLKLEELSVWHADIAMQESDVIDEEMISAVHRAFEQLPEKTKDIVYKVMCENYTYAETADYFGISINTVKTALRKGMQTLRNKLGVDPRILFMFFYKKKFI